MGTVSLSPYTQSQARRHTAEPCQEGSCRSLTVMHKRAGHCFCLGFRLEKLKQAALQRWMSRPEPAGIGEPEQRHADTSLEGHSDNPNRMSFSSVFSRKPVSHVRSGGQVRLTSWKTQRARLYPLRGHPEQAVRVSCGRELARTLHSTLPVWN